MWPDWVSNPGPLPLQSGALLTALRDPAVCVLCLCVREREGMPIHSCLHGLFFLGQKLVHVRGKASLPFQ